MSSSFLGNNFINQLNEPECDQQSLKACQLQTIFEISLDAIVIADDQGCYLEVNPAACELFGLEKDELLGHCISEFAETGFDFPSVSQKFPQLEKVRGEFQLVRPDGEIRVVEYVATTNFFPPYHLCVMRDITNCQKAEAKVQELTRQLAQTQAQLREAEINSLSIATPAEYHYLEQIVRHIPGVIYQFRMRPDGTFHFPYSSEGMREIYGVSPEEVREDATAVFQHLHPEDIDHVSQSIFASAEQLTPWYCEYRVCLPNEELIWLLGYSTPQREADGSTVWHGYIRDITESKNRELALHESEAKFSTIFHTSPDPAWIATLTEGRCLNVNENLCQFLETTYKEIIGKTCVEIGLWDDIKDLHHFRQTLIQEGRIQNFEVVIRTSSRQAKTVLMSAKVERLNGQDCVIGMIKDISDRKQAEMENLQSQNFLNSIIENIPNMVFVKDAENLQFVRFNKAGEELLGYPREALLGKSDADFFLPEEAQFFIAKDREVLSQGKILDIPEEKIETSHQGTRILHTRKIPIIDESGNSQYLLGISEDITEFKQSQAKLIEITRLQQF
jgi:PAS domain S-box-containing protein